MSLRLSVALVLLLLASPAAADHTVLHTVSTNTSAGTWSQIPSASMTGWDNGQRTQNPGGGNCTILQYSGKATWNPIANRFVAVAATHGSPGSCDGPNYRAIQYNDATNTWSDLPNPGPSGTDAVHVFDGTTMGPDGAVYVTLYNDRNVRKLANGAGSWQVFPLSMSSNQVATSNVYFPDYPGGARVIHVDGDWGIWAVNPTTGANTCIASTNAGNPPDASFPCFGTPVLSGFSANGPGAIYSPACQCVLLGGGTTAFYRLNSSGTFTAMNKSGGPAGFGTGGAHDSANGQYITEPVTGKILNLSNTANGGDGALRLFDPTVGATGTWTTLLTAAQMPAVIESPGVDGGSTGMACAGVPLYNVSLCIKTDGQNWNGATVWVYKYQASAPSSATLTVTKSGTGTGTVASSPPGISCGGDCSEAYTTPASVTLTATGDPGSPFVAFSGGGCTTSPCTVNLTVNTTVQATFNSTQVGADADFASRCRSAPTNGSGPSADGVVLRCFGFDDASVLTTGPVDCWGCNFGSFPNTPRTSPAVDTTIKLSGAGAMRFTTPAASGSQGGGVWFANFSGTTTAWPLADRLYNIGPGQEIWIQYRYRPDSNTLSRANNPDADASHQVSGFKMSHIGTGDSPSCNTSGGPSATCAANTNGNYCGGGGCSSVPNSCDCPTSCSEMEVVAQPNFLGGQHPFIAYTTCLSNIGQPPIQKGGGPDLEPNASPARSCIYPGPFGEPNCQNMLADTWYTVKIHVKIGNWNQWDNEMDFYIGAAGQPVNRVISCAAGRPCTATDGGPVPAGTSVPGWFLFNSKTNFFRMGKVWLNPYVTNQGGPVQAQNAWFDELIISKQDIPDPGAIPDTSAPTAPGSLTATPVAGGTQINLTWTASTDDVGVAGYYVERCQGGSGCAPFSQLSGMPITPTSFSNTGLSPNTSYSYRVRAADAAGNFSPYSLVAIATTAADTQAPTAPGGLAATPINSAQINLSWTASTDNVGVTGYRVERCQGSASCVNFVELPGMPLGAVTTFQSTGLTGSTIYRYRVRAQDVAGNLSAYSNLATATTPAGTLVSMTVTLAGNGSGLVTSTSSNGQPTQISCPATCSVSFPQGTTVTLSGQATSGSSFSGWNGAGCTGSLPCGVLLNSSQTVIATFASGGNIFGLEWPGSGSTRRMLFWGAGSTTTPTVPAIYGPGGQGMTYVFRVFPRKKTCPGDQTGYYTTFFWGNNGNFAWNAGQAGTYYGFHPYPAIGSPPSNCNPGAWEIAVNSADPNTGVEVVWDRWYQQVMRVRRVNATTTTHEFYYDWPDQTKLLSETVVSSTWATTNPPNPAIVIGQAADSCGPPGTCTPTQSWGGYPGWEEFNGIIRGVQIYTSFLSLADVTAEIATPKSSAAGLANIWYLNLDPRPTDVTDKKATGTPNHPQWACPTVQATCASVTEWSGQGTTVVPPQAPINLTVQPSGFDRIQNALALVVLILAVLLILATRRRA